MITTEAVFLYLLLGSNVTFLATACFFFASFESRCKRLEKFWASPSGSALAASALAQSDDHDCSEQVLLTQRLEKRLVELQRTVKLMETNESKPQLAQERNLPIENALRMAKLGASIDDLTKSCGLNVGEARLMQKLHGKAAILAAGNP